VAQPPTDREKAARALRGATRLDELTAGRRKFHAATFPVLEIPFKLMSLGKHHLQLAQGEAHKRWKALGLEVNTYTVDDFMDEQLYQSLHLACRSAEKPDSETFAVDADDFRRNVDLSMMEALLDMWRPIQAAENPGPYQGMNNDELRALGLPMLSADDQAEILEAAKKKDASRLRRFERDALISWLLTSGSRPSI